jgi:peptidoglycan/xylan/chitin deacetylase (PgdA/CDA1 family)
MSCVLMYHTFEASSVQPADPFYCVPRQTFRNHLLLVREKQCRVVSPGEIAFGVAHDEKVVSITIDDGDSSIYSVALPLLIEFGMTATVFLVTGLVGSPGFLDWEQVQECRQGGISFQSHSHTHPRFDLLTDEEIREEMRRSKAVLEDALGEQVEGFAIPGGAGNLASIAGIAHDVGYSYVATSEWGYNRPKPAPYRLERISVMTNQDITTFGRFLIEDELLVRRLQLMKFGITTIKNIIGQSAYEMLKGLWVRRG